MASEILVNTGSGNGLMPDSNKPLPESMLTYHQQGPPAFTPGNGKLDTQDINPQVVFEIYTLPVPPQSWEMTANANSFMFPNKVLT